MKNIWSIL